MESKPLCGDEGVAPDAVKILDTPPGSNDCVCGNGEGDVHSGTTNDGGNAITASCSPPLELRKILLAGDSGTGKTTLLVRFHQDRFLGAASAPTVGVGYANKVVDVDGAKVKLQIWDTAGQERFRSITRAYYRDAEALLLLYDVSNKQSFENIRAWLTEIKEFAQEDVVVMLLGNKADVGSERVVKKEEGEKLAEENQVPFMETSAKTGLNVDLAFTAVARIIKDRKEPDGVDSHFSLNDYIAKEAAEKKTCC